VFTEFKQYIKSIIIQIKEILVEAYNLIGKVEQYHNLLRYVYKIICNKFRSTKTNSKISFQITIKTINDSAGPDSIILILLVFGAYPRITNNLAPVFIITKRIKTIRKTTKEIKCFYAERKITDVLVIRNSLNTVPMLELHIQSDIRV
jgi:hypothetical protein